MITPTVMRSEQATDVTTIWPILYLVPDTIAVSVSRSPTDSRPPNKPILSVDGTSFLLGNRTAGDENSPVYILSNRINDNSYANYLQFNISYS